VNSNPESKTQRDVGAVLHQHARFEELLVAGDLDGIVTLADEAVVDMAPGIPASVGKAAFEERLRMILGQYRVEIESEVKQAEVSGDFAFVRSEIEGGWIPNDGSPPIQIKGKWLQIWKHQPDAGWKLLQNIWNRDD
jgi:ketosteroid isomerase-like protein